jgi:hypothetical protein
MREQKQYEYFVSRISYLSNIKGLKIKVLKHENLNAANFVATFLSEECKAIWQQTYKYTISLFVSDTHTLTGVCLD